jgi:hypothetical protein
MLSSKQIILPGLLTTSTLHLCRTLSQLWSMIQDLCRGGEMERLLLAASLGMKWRRRIVETGVERDSGASAE